MAKINKTKEEIKAILQQLDLAEISYDEACEALGLDDEEESEDGEAQTNDAPPPTGGPKPGGGNP